MSTSLSKKSLILLGGLFLALGILNDLDKKQLSIVFLFNLIGLS
jgi:hypothetical protein